MSVKSYIDKLAYIHLKDQKALVTLSQGKDVWYLPGGKRKEGESDQEALIREISEELSVSLKLETLKYYGIFEAPAHGKPEGTIVQMTCYTGEFEGKLKPASEIARYEYFNYGQKRQTSLVDHLIFENLNSKGLLN